MSQQQQQQRAPLGIVSANVNNLFIQKSHKQSIKPSSFNLQPTSNKLDTQKKREIQGNRKRQRVYEDQAEDHQGGQKDLVDKTISSLKVENKSLKQRIFKLEKKLLDLSKQHTSLTDISNHGIKESKKMYSEEDFRIHVKPLEERIAQLEVERDQWKSEAAYFSTMYKVSQEEISILNEEKKNILNHREEEEADDDDDDDGSIRSVDASQDDDIDLVIVHP